jgi:hypothetical protein
MHKHFFSFALVTLPFYLALACLPSVAQGFPSFVPQDCGQYDCVNLQNLTVSLNVPVMSKSGAFPFNAALLGGDSYFSYNGTNLQPGIVTTPITPAINGVLSPYGYAEVFYSSSSTGATCPSGATGSGPYIEYTHLFLQMPDGTVHSLPASDVVYTPGTSSTCASTLTDQVIDGTGWTITINGSIYNEADQAGVTIVSSGGMTLAAALNSESLSDPESTPNKISYNVSQQTYTDTLGMAALTVNANAYGQLGWFDTLGNNPTESQTFLTGSNAILKTSFGCSGRADYPGTSYAAGLTTKIGFPDTSAILLTWEQNEVTPADYTGRLASITERGGGVITYNYNPSGATSAPYGFNCTGLAYRLSERGAVYRRTFRWSRLGGSWAARSRRNVPHGTASWKTRDCHSGEAQWKSSHSRLPGTERRWKGHYRILVEPRSTIQQGNVCLRKEVATIQGMTWGLAQSCTITTASATPFSRPLRAWVLISLQRQLIPRAPASASDAGGVVPRGSLPRKETICRVLSLFPKLTHAPREA